MNCVRVYYLFSFISISCPYLHKPKLYNNFYYHRRVMKLFTFFTCTSFFSQESPVTLFLMLIIIINILRAGGVEMRGLHATPITRKIPLGVPVLEKNVFVPNYGKQKMKVCIQ